MILVGGLARIPKVRSLLRDFFGGKEAYFLMLLLLLLSLSPSLSTLLESLHACTLQVDEAILIGGSTRLPKVQSLMRDFFGGEGEIFIFTPSLCTSVQFSIVLLLLLLLHHYCYVHLRYRSMKSSSLVGRPASPRCSPSCAISSAARSSTTPSIPTKPLPTAPLFRAAF